MVSKSPGTVTPAKKPPKVKIVQACSSLISQKRYCILSTMEVYQSKQAKR